MGSLNYKLGAFDKSLLGTGIQIIHDYSMMYVTLKRFETGFEMKVSYQFLDHFTGDYKFFRDAFREKESQWLKSIEGQSSAASKFLANVKPSMPSTHDPKTGAKVPVFVNEGWVGMDIWKEADYAMIEAPDHSKALQAEIEAIKKYTAIAAQKSILQDKYSDIMQEIYGKEVKKQLKPNPFMRSNQGYAAKLLNVVTDIKAEVKCPSNDSINYCGCGCGEASVSVTHCIYEQSVWGMVQHLNDSHKWTREKIADWIDDLQDNHGLNFTIESPNMDRS